MTALPFLTTLQALGVEVSAAGNRLHYRAPEGTITPALREQMVTNKEEILALLNHSERASFAPVPAAANRYPLSPAQERLWFMDQLVPGIALYNEAVALRLSGILNVAALIESLNELVRRHEALRTSFGAVGGQPYQRISPPVNMDVSLVDLSHLPQGTRHNEARKVARDLGGKPFDLEHPLLLRAALIVLGPEEHVLCLSLHHIICDGWSRVILMQDLSRLYGSYRRGEAPVLPELDFQYLDFVFWQKERIDTGELIPEMEYWRQQWYELPPVINLPTDRVRPLVQSFRGESCHVELSQAVSDGVKTLSRANGVTSFMTLLAAWQVLLGHYCSQDELIVGTVVANRTRAGLENIVGLMVNTLPIKGDLTGNPTFRGMLGRVRDAAIGAYKHQECPYEKLVVELVHERDISRNPLVELMFVMEEGLTAQVDLDGLTVTEEKIDLGIAKYDLMMVLKEKGGRFEGRIEYNTDIFDGPKITKMGESYSLLVAAAIAEPDQQIWDMPVLTETERQRVLTEWNETSVQYAGYKNVHQMFEQQADRAPDAIAAIYEGEHITYRELNYNANQLAHCLRKRGVGPDVPVGLCLERSLEMAVGVLAVLKAGGACLPLDLSWPKDRLRFMLEDAHSSILLTQNHLLERLPHDGATVVCMDSEDRLAEGRRRENPRNVSAADGVAYVIYTSGSTGRPKGVCLPHRALANLIQWHTSKFMLEPRTLQFASLSFDVSFYEMFTTWASGGTLFIAPEEFRLDTHKLAAFLADRHIEKAVLPVIVLQQLAEEHGFRKQMFTNLREVITTGEQLQITKPIGTFFDDFRLCSLHNHYGPSETHVATAYTLNGAPSSWPGLPPIGRPIANARVHILNKLLKPVPVGTIGEVHIGGGVLARGYLNRPDLTAELFIPDQFSGRPGERLYRTGDVARYTGDGNIHFLGRTDHQVKIRGFRVELGEVESTLNWHPAVREAVVVTRDCAPGHKRLVAYVAADRKQKLGADELRAYLKERLPDHMVPSAYVIMERLPLTPNGKIDRAALTLSYRPPVEQIEELTSARTPAEELVATIWREVLGVEKVGIHSNFFHQGGHSMLATQIILRLREIFRIEMPVRSIFEAPTISGIVKEMSRIWEGREIVDEIAWTYLQVEQLSDRDVSENLAQRHSRRHSAE
jgi:amino acid adenylation domain-containing protein